MERHEEKQHLLENQDDCVIQVRELTVWSPEEKSWWRRKVTKPKTVVLNNVSSCIRCGELVAIIGPSGAGKTTFLASLAGKVTLPTEGSVLVRGVNVKTIQGVSEIVPQTDVFMDNLTVMEHLVFMTEMKLGHSDKLENKSTLYSTIEKIKLKTILQTQIGNLSGGEKRLLSLATSLLSSPEILLCDEPTTGLDSYNALLIIEVLREIAESGRTVVCSVHQPSSELFKVFGNVILMAEGRILFQGTKEQCQNIFESLDLHCPKNYNPAEFYIRTVSTSGYANENILERILDSTRNRSHHSHPTCSGQFPHVNQTYRLQRNWTIQVYLLLWRSSISLTRAFRYHLLQLFVVVGMSAIAIGTCYVGISGSTQKGIQNIHGFLWLICSEVSFSLSYNALYTFQSELALFRREVGVYKTSAYLVARFLNLMPRVLVWPIAFVVIATLAVDQPNYVMTSLQLVVALMVTGVTATAYGLGMGALFISSGMMADIMASVDLPLLLMSGVLLKLSSIVQWVQPVKYVSHFYYGMDAMSNIYWKQIKHIECPSNSTTTCISDGAAVIVEKGYSKNYVAVDSVGFLTLTMLWSFLAYYGLKREARKGYAY